MTDVLDRLPAWGILLAVVVWLSLQAVERVAKWRVDRRSHPPEAHPPAVHTHARHDDETTGQHDVRLVLDADRRAQEVLTTSRENHAILKRLADAEVQQSALLVRIVDLVQRQGDQQAAIVQRQAETASVLRDIAKELTDWRRTTTTVVRDGTHG